MKGSETGTTVRGESHGKETPGGCWISGTGTAPMAQQYRGSGTRG